MIALHRSCSLSPALRDSGPCQVLQQPVPQPDGAQHHQRVQGPLRWLRRTEDAAAPAKGAATGLVLGGLFDAMQRYFSDISMWDIYRWVDCRRGRKAL